MSDVPPVSSSSQPSVPGAERPLVEWRSVLTGALVGLGLLVVFSVISAILDHYLDNFDNSGWRYPLSVGVLVSLMIGGYIAGRATPDGALTNGTLAGLGAFLLWIPARVLIWLVRDEDKGLFTGHSAVLRPGQIFGYIVIASTLGMLGGWLGARAVTRARNGSRASGARSAS